MISTSQPPAAGLLMKPPLRKSKGGLRPAKEKAKEPEPELVCQGPSELCDKLRAALLCQWRGNGKRAVGCGYTHGFHPYKALMEPLAVSELLELLPGQNAVMDPFVGSGTTMLEVMLAGRAAVGYDVSPLAVGIARYQCWKPALAHVEYLRSAVRTVVASLDTSDTNDIDWEQARLVVKAHADEMNRQDTAGETCPPGIQGALWFLLSHEEVYHWESWRKPRSIAYRYERTAERYIEKLVALCAAVPAGTPSAFICVADARHYDTVPNSTAAIAEAKKAEGTAVETEAETEAVTSLETATPTEAEAVAAQETETQGANDGGGGGGVGVGAVNRPLIDAVLTSPPYPGVYNYLEDEGCSGALSQYIVRELQQQQQQQQKKHHQLVAVPTQSVSNTAVVVVETATASAGGEQQCAEVEKGLLQLHDSLRILEIGSRGERQQLEKEQVDTVTHENMDSNANENANENKNGNENENGNGNDGDSYSTTTSAFAERWQEDTITWLQAAASQLQPNGRIAMLIGDDAGINTLTSITAAAKSISTSSACRFGLKVLASASITEQATRPWKKQRRRGYRCEHTILLEKVC